MRDLPEIGQKVRVTTDVVVYELRKGDIGEVIEIHADRGQDSYIVCRWSNGKRDMGWWLDVIEQRDYPNVLKNLEPVGSMDDTREYLETVSSLA